MNTDGKKILLVDDNQLFLNSFSEAIRKFCGFQGEVKEASTGSEALQQANASFFDLCFVDVNLPDINGIDLMRKINAISPETKVAVMTASYIPDDLKKSIEKDASLFVEKPLDLHLIKDFLRQEVGDLREPHIDDGRSGISPVTERRRQERKPSDRTFQYSVQIPYVKEHKGHILNVCTGGQCFVTETRHEPGLVLMVDHAGQQKAGIVKWSVLDQDTKMYRTGIKFM